MPINITLKQANELLSKMGAAVVVVEDETTASEAVDIEALVGEIIPEPPEVQQVDENAIKAAAIGKQLGALYSLMAKTFGIPRGQIDGLKQEELLPKLKELVDSRYSQTEENLRQQLEDAVNANNKLAEDKDAEREAAVNEIQAKFTKRNILDAFEKAYDKVPKKSGEVRELAELALLRAEKNHSLVWNEAKGEVEFFDKNNPEQRVIVGKTALGINDYLVEFNKKIGNDAPDTSHVIPATVKKDTPAGIVTNDSNQQNTMNPAPFDLSKLAQSVNEQLGE